jgi:hypothetical protein
MAQPIRQPYAEGLFDRALGKWSVDNADVDPFATFAIAVMEQEVRDGRLAPVVDAEAEPDAFAQSWLNLLLDNHRLPPELQLDADGLQPARALLAGYFLKQGDFQQAVARLLSFVEERFNDGHFAQATALLQIFETDVSTRRNNERHLFYEEMQAAFGATRNTAAPKIEAWRRLQEGAPNPPWERLGWLVEHLRVHARIRLHALDTPRVEGTLWGPATASLSFAQAEDFFEHVHPPQWRVPESARLRSHIVAHLRFFSIEQYVTRLTRVAYFLILATGRTGFERLILHFYRWLGEHFDVVPAHLMPRLHRETTVDEMFLSESLQNCVELVLSSPREALVMPSEHHVDDAVIQVCEQLSAIDPREVAEGDYDLGGLFLDQILGFNSAPVDHRLRMHRLL